MGAGAIVEHGAGAKAEVDAEANVKAEAGANANADAHPNAVNEEEPPDFGGEERADFGGEQLRDFIPEEPPNFGGDDPAGSRVNVESRDDGDVKDEHTKADDTKQLRQRVDLLIPATAQAESLKEALRDVPRKPKELEATAQADSFERGIERCPSHTEMGIITFPIRRCQSDRPPFRAHTQGGGPYPEPKRGCHQ